MAPTASATSLPLMRRCARRRPVRPRSSLRRVPPPPGLRPGTEDDLCDRLRHVSADQRRHHVALVAGQHHTADDRDTQRAADLERHVLLAEPIPESPWGTDPMTELVAVAA